VPIHIVFREPAGKPAAPRPHPSPGHDAPLIGERAATRGRSAMERGDERAGVKRVIRSCFSLANGSDGGNRDPMAATRPPKRVGQTDDAEPATRLSSPVFCAAPSPAHHDAPLIAERAATRGRGAMEGGDAHADVKPALSVRAPASRTGSTGGNVDSLTATRPTERVSQSPSLRRRRDQAWCRSLRISSGFAQPIRTKR
jgi:hypothetical protein